MGESLCRSIQIQRVFLDLIPPPRLPYGTGVTKGPRIWGGFYVLSILASNSSFLRSKYFDKVFELLIRVCLDLFTRNPMENLIKIGCISFLILGELTQMLYWVHKSPGD